MRAIVFVILCVVGVAGQADEIIGKTDVIDGDSIRMGSEEIRLQSIDAPEGKQFCKVRGKDWRCGRAAAETLTFLVTGTDIRCTWFERDRHERALATCFRRDVEINAMMVELGMALAYRGSGNYSAEEERARAAQRGLWDAEFVPPWEWRQGVRLDHTDCPVKGNVNREGAKIYHARGWRDYGRVTINKDEGDRCFTTEQQAKAAGFRPAMQ